MRWTSRSGRVGQPRGQRSCHVSGRHTPSSCSRAWATRKRAASPASTRRPADAGGPCRAVPLLREAERIHTADRLREKASLRTIAADLGRSPSTVSRHIRRNGMPYEVTPLAGPTPPRRAQPRRSPPAPPQIPQDRPEPNCGTS
ncbi:helix-turn-helix domain-containing protein [Streptomyces sp. NPDC096012]|uniref:helix-turn-helix domain-containing protein n=1 Tax=Streptomyces sp. NPDC096012 TaxID=3155684 RepID=UPI00336A2669